MTRSDRLNNALLRADLWRVLALSFSTPTEESLADLQGVCDELASGSIADDLPFRQGLAELARSHTGVTAKGAVETCGRAVSPEPVGAPRHARQCLRMDPLGDGSLPLP